MSQTFSYERGYGSQPAGSRMPKPYKKTYTDKLPEWISKFKAEGMTDAEIGEVIKGKAAKYIGKWGNHSKVGVLINRYDNEQQALEELTEKPRNAAPRDKTEPNQFFSPKAGGKRMGSLPSLQQRKSAVTKRRTKSIGGRHKNNTMIKS